MAGKTYHIIIARSAVEMVSEISDRKAQKSIKKAIGKLATDADKQGKPLVGPLRGYRSLRAYHQQYRIVYKIIGATVTVLVVAVGIRKEGDKNDIYERISKMTGL